MSGGTEAGDGVKAYGKHQEAYRPAWTARMSFSTVGAAEFLLEKEVTLRGPKSASARDRCGVGDDLVKRKN